MVTELKNRSSDFNRTALYALDITFFVPYKRAGTHFSIHPAKRQYTPPSKKKPEKLRKPKYTYQMGQHQEGASEGLFMSGLLRD